MLGHSGIPEILEDHRWGGVTRYIGDPGELLLIHPAVRKCVAFLGRKNKGEDRIIATGFFLTQQVGRFYFDYLVTAAHIIENTKSRDYSDDGFVYVYLNTKDGRRFKPLPTEIKHWYFHPSDSAIDVAVHPFNLSSELDHTALSFEVPPEVEANPHNWHIDIGTDVFITGLFLRHFGRDRNIPILRTGTIAALPEEPVDIGEPDEERNIKAYLIETHSTGGLSGSPVFANPIDIAINGPNYALKTMHIWIGVVSAHWDYNPDAGAQDRINSGIAIVSPKESVMEVLQHPRLIEMREKDIKRRLKSRAPSLDDAGGVSTQKTLAPKEEDRIEIPIPTERQVLDLFKKATRKRDKT